jgi:DinB family protein
MPSTRRWKSALAEHETAVNDFLAASQRVPSADWHRRPAAGRWSTADLALHICRAYEVARESVETGKGMRRLVSKRMAWLSRTFILPVILLTKRFPRVAAPSEVGPDCVEAECLTRELAASRLRKSADDAAAAFRRAADQSPAPVLHHAYFGRLNPYSGLRLLSAHTHHHTRQLG